MTVKEGHECRVSRLAVRCEHRSHEYGKVCAAHVHGNKWAEREDARSYSSL
eukprot:CAMPEP_0181222348 /NCGR_PEP_ID=MMETSP1096-20121128/29913_1 /TAXON_ID=156174 ORGANISM="Chrysochromulina ericina, Strain CCMP281" /NCGR_SAMPLE_ID=MMETSP1096 /ASSEMBLY_ACC=CAM_ASM_000453 /LENGTH=50 /DNA_ID=CAMNT_0023315093 /DNA_START=576 /DNA_END=728 /DNA_ORIENTATION=-